MITAGVHLGIRQSVNQNQSLTVIAAILLVIASVIYVMWYVRAPGPSASGTREFFSDNDGVSWFVDDGSKIPPFDHNGKQAVLAKVFKCKDGREFVGYLQKFTDEVHDRIQKSRKDGSVHSGPVRVQANPFSGIMLKKPREGEWVKDNDPAAHAVKIFTCPGGGTDYEPVPP